MKPVAPFRRFKQGLMQVVRVCVSLHTVFQPRETGRPEPPRFRGLENRGCFHSAARASVAFLAPIQATTPNPILLIMSAML